MRYRRRSLLDLLQTEGDRGAIKFMIARIESTNSRIESTNGGYLKEELIVMKEPSAVVSPPQMFILFTYQGDFANDDRAFLNGICLECSPKSPLVPHHSNLLASDCDDQLVRGFLAGEHRFAPGALQGSGRRLRILSADGSITEGNAKRHKEERSHRPPIIKRSVARLPWILLPFGVALPLPSRSPTRNRSGSLRRRTGDALPRWAVDGGRSLSDGRVGVSTPRGAVRVDGQGSGSGRAAGGRRLLPDDRGDNGGPVRKARNTFHRAAAKVGRRMSR
jgi:hypothetical protein